VLNRSIERDYDINYHTRAARRAMQECLDNLEALLAIGYEPVACTRGLTEQWRAWTEKLDTILY